MLRRIRIDDCVHYCGFAYGQQRFNPYENYILGLSRQQPPQVLQAQFETFIQHYRPRDLATALGTSTQQPVRLWHLPWKSWRKLWRREGWCENPEQVIDILTHFCEQGVRRSRLREEYLWLEQAWQRISREGYRPDEHSYISVFELRGASKSRYIVVDGNHRLSALAALGHSEVLVRQPWGACARRAHAPFWPLVLSGHVVRQDALKLFDAYFTGNDHPQRASLPARWLEG